MPLGVVREDAKIPENRKIMTCVAMAYPQESIAFNDAKSTRRVNEEIVSYVSSRSCRAPGLIHR